MVKKTIYLLLLSVSLLCADSIDDAVVNIMGESSYQANQKLLKRLFAQKNKFFLDSKQERVDYYKIAKVLKDQGVFKLKFKTPQEVNLDFKAKTSPIFLMKTIDDTLSMIGYSKLAITKVQYTQKNTDLTFAFNAESGVNPEVVLSELKKRGIIASKVVRKNQTDWLYELKILDPSMSNAELLKSDDRLELQNISGEYWFRAKRAGTMKIVKQESKMGWSPKVVLYDQNLNILKILTQKETTTMKIDLPSQVAFVMVTDFYDSDRLKNGIIVTFSPLTAGKK